MVKVIPITRSGFSDTLTFFSKNKLEEGSVIDAPVRNKPTPSLVAEVTPAREEKLSLRGSSFSLKKISPRNSYNIFTPGTIRAFKDIADYHALPLGVVLAHFTPKSILSSASSLKHTNIHSAFEETASDKLVMQAEYEERVRMYRNLTREAFARGESVMVIAPTIAEVENLYEQLHRGIERQTLRITSALTKKATLTLWNKAITETEPLLIIGTYSIMSIPRKDVNAIVVERESSRSYVGLERPHIDIRYAAERIAQRNNARAIFADFPLRIETRARLERGEFEELTRLQVSTRFGAPVQIIDARTKDDSENERSAPKKKRFSALTDTAQEKIEHELKKGGRVFLYAARKGLAPLTVCNDCGTPITDPATGAPMTLHKTEAGNMFLSYRSGALMPANISCKKCGSWNLVSLGIGVERVHEEVEKMFKDYDVFLLSKDTANTHAKAKKIRDAFFNTRSAILVGTERALPYLREPVELSVVASIDSMLSLSAWRAHEYALTTLFYIRDHTQDAMLVQTRQHENEVIRAFALGNPTEFIRNELKERKTFGYPPFTTFIGLTWSGTEVSVERLSQQISELLKTWDVVGPLPPRAVGRNRYLARAVIRLERNEWPNAPLVSLLKDLPREVSIAVDPDEIV